MGPAAWLDNRRLPPEFPGAFVNDSRERRETCKQEEEKIQVRMVPESCRDRPGARTQAPNDRKGNDCGQRYDFGRAIVSAQLIRTIMTLRYRTETTPYVAQSLLRTWAGTNGIGVRKIAPR